MIVCLTHYFVCQLNTIVTVQGHVTHVSFLIHIQKSVQGKHTYYIATCKSFVEFKRRLHVKLCEDTYLLKGPLDQSACTPRSNLFGRGRGHTPGSATCWCLYRHQCDLPERFGKIDLSIANSLFAVQTLVVYDYPFNSKREKFLKMSKYLPEHILF